MERTAAPCGHATNSRIISRWGGRAGRSGHTDEQSFRTLLPDGLAPRPPGRNTPPSGVGANPVRLLVHSVPLHGPFWSNPWSSQRRCGLDSGVESLFRFGDAGLIRAQTDPGSIPDPSWPNSDRCEVDPGLIWSRSGLPPRPLPAGWPGRSWGDLSRDTRSALRKTCQTYAEAAGQPRPAPLHSHAAASRSTSDRSVTQERSATASANGAIPPRRQRLGHEPRQQRCRLRNAPCGPRCARNQAARAAERP